MSGTRNTFSERYLWRSVLELYYQEKLRGAYELAEEIGIGDWGSSLRWFRVLEAEYLTSIDSMIRQSSEWLSIEVAKDILPEAQDAIEALCLHEIDSVRKRLGVVERPPTRICILVQEADAPWATSPYGYCIEKVPFTKICLPHHLLANRERMAQAVRHEYAHVLTVNLGKGRVPRWLSEAISTLVEDEPGAKPEPFPRDAPWRSASDLADVFASVPMPVGSRWVTQVMGSDWVDTHSQVSPRKTHAVSAAYAQSALIGRYLRAKFGEQKIGALLKVIGDDSMGNSLRRVILGRDPVEMALKKVVGLGQAQLFDAAKSWA